MTERVESENGTITARMSQWASQLDFGQLSDDAVHCAKRFLLDSLGCALGGFLQHDVKIALTVLEEHGGRGPATVIGTGKQMDPVSASLLNALMVRVQDYNDFGGKNEVIPQAKSIEPNRDGTLNYRAPRHSVSSLVLKLK